MKRIVREQEVELVGSEGRWVERIWREQREVNG